MEFVNRLIRVAGQVGAESVVQPYKRLGRGTYTGRRFCIKKKILENRQGLAAMPCSFVLANSHLGFRRERVGF